MSRAGEQSLEGVRSFARRLNDPGNPDASALARACRDQGGGPPIVVSACLLGAKVRYDGRDRRTDAVEQATAGRAVLPLCPELLGGMGCPRPAVHFARGDGDTLATDPAAAAVVDGAGTDHAAALLAGARRALALAQAAGAREAILKERSPSCGCHQIHGADGALAGRGAFAALAARSGIACRSDEEIAAPQKRR
ncbi:MAG TPA: DUF523 domain-containing protein [Polyangia bacterium]|jgi:uncharacterized protein YbbK (DUF523 family)|nr:DUF523 domain-containing protein [Polyangia bacterium]